MNTAQMLGEWTVSSSPLVGVVKKRLQRHPERSVPVGRQMLAWAAVTWAPLFVACWVEGTLVGQKVRIPFLLDPGPHARFLLAASVLVGLKRVVDPVVASCLRYLEQGGLMPDGGEQPFQEAVLQLRRARDSAWADLLTGLLALFFSVAVVFVSRWRGDITLVDSWMAQGERAMSVAGYLYFLVSTPVLAGLLLRWLWRLLIWARFLRRISRIRWKVFAHHPDLSGGLGVLSGSLVAFSLVFVALSTMASATLAQEILYGGTTLQQVAWEAAAFTLGCVALLTVPLLFFIRQLTRTKWDGLVELGMLGSRLSRAFGKKWLTPTPTQTQERILDSADSSSMADFSNTYNLARQMWVVPVSLRALTELAALIAAPFLPLVLTQFSPQQLFTRALQVLS